MKWSEFKQKVESKLEGQDPEICFILFDSDYNKDKITIAVMKKGLMIEG